VFDIQQGVSINIFIKNGKKNNNTLAEVFHYDIFGKRNDKYGYLIGNNLNSIDWKKLNPENPFYFFVPKDNDSKEEYEKGFSVTDLFYVSSLGLLTKRDNLSIGFTNTELKQNLLYFLDKNNSIKDVCSYFEIPIIDKDKWNAENAREKTNKNNLDLEIANITYRPFDKRKIFYNEYFVARRNKKVLGNFKQPNCAIVIGRQGQAVGNSLWDIVFISDDLIDQNIFRRGGGTVFPLYRYVEHFGTIEQTLNLNTDILFDIQYNFIDEEIGKGGQYVDSSGREIDIYFEPINLIDYIYAILHSPAYREKYKEFLKIDFPRVPFPENAEHFFKLAAFGEQLRELHLLENITAPINFANYPVSGSDNIENSFTEKSNDYRDGKVWINDTQYFDNVPQTAWNFYIGGYQPAQKWLKDRKGRKLNFDDTQHYQKIVYALAETTKIMEEIDK
jgi:predicted helicase